MLAIGFIHSNLAAGEVSVASYLDKSVSCEISEKSLTGAVHALMQKVSADDPAARNIKFEFVNSSQFDERKQFELKFDDVKLSKVLYQIGMVYKHAVNYDFRRNTVVFTAAGNGSDDERDYKITRSVSDKLGLDWSSEAELEKSLDKFGVGATLVKTNLSERTFTASGLPASLDHIDMLIYVFSQKVTE
ncbi:hypothetical protein GCM10023212_14450 [Luteolibacter yonseiensis]